MSEEKEAYPVTPKQREELARANRLIEIAVARRTQLLNEIANDLGVPWSNSQYDPMKAAFKKPPEPAKPPVPKAKP